MFCSPGRGVTRMAGSGLFHPQPWLQIPMFPIPTLPLSAQVYSPRLRPGKLPLPKSRGIKGSQEPLESPTPRPVTLDGAEDPFPELPGPPSDGVRHASPDWIRLERFLKTQRPCHGNPQGIWGPECGGLTWKGRKGCEVGQGQWGQSGC